jgi:endoglycosylceramidase
MLHFYNHLILLIILLNIFHCRGKSEKNYITDSYDIQEVFAEDILIENEIFDAEETIPENAPCTEGRWIKDQYGRILILRGANVTQGNKSPPFIAEWLTMEDFREIRDYGFNVVRFLIIWEAVEPEKEKYDDGYLKKVEEIVSWAGEFGIYVVLDMHQDLYARKFGGTGAPQWAVFDDGLNFEIKNPWFMTYFEPAVIRAFDNFWENKNGVQDSYINMWKHVAERFKDNEIVLGYEIMNEPFLGSVSEDITKSEKEKLKAFYEKTISGIRKIDSRHLIFYEPNVISGCLMESGLYGLLFDNIVFAPHYYDSLVEINKIYDGNDETMRSAFKLCDSTAEQMKNPWWLGEYGITYGIEGCGEYLRDQSTLLDELRAGSAVWNYDYGHGFGILTKEGTDTWMAPLLSRPFPQKISGEPVSYRFNEFDRIFELILKVDKKIQKPSEIFVPEKHYPFGFDIELSQKISFEWVQDKQILRLLHDDTIKDPEIKLTIRPKPKEKNPEFCFSTHISINNKDAQEQELQMESDLGIHVLRFDFIWNILEKEENKFNFEEYDNLVDNAKKYGIEFIGLLSYSAPWAQKDPDNHSSLEPEHFYDFAKNIASHFKGKVRYWEIWNEENLFIFFKPEPNPDAYGNLLKMAYKGIKEADPEAVVSFGGMSSIDWLYGKTWKFLDDVHIAHPDIGNYYDVVSIHPYTAFQEAPPEEENIQGNIPTMIKTVRDILVNWGEEEKPVWMTEFGWPACPCPPEKEPDLPIPNVSYEDQAKYLVRTFILAIASGIDILCWYDFMDSDGSSKPSSENYFGLVKYDSDPSSEPAPEKKYAFFAYKTMIDMIGGMNFIGETMVNDLWTYNFSGAGKSVSVIWTPLKEKEMIVEYQLKGKNTDVFNMTGEKISPENTGSKLFLSVKDSPIYVVEGK